VAAHSSLDVNDTNDTNNDSLYSYCLVVGVEQTEQAKEKQAKEKVAGNETGWKFLLTGCHVKKEEERVRQQCLPF